MAETGITIKPSDGMTRIQATCDHQSGLIYVVPAERSWVCDSKHLPAHALAGFFRELIALDHAEVKQLMLQWGIYYRQLPLTGETVTGETVTEGPADAPKAAPPS